MKIAATALALLLALPACAQQAPAPAASATVQDADPALWVVKDKDTTVYLFGTIHVLKPGLSWFDEAVKTAFDRSQTLVLEMVEPDAATQAKVVAATAFDPGATPLTSQLSPNYRGAFAKAMEELAYTGGYTAIYPIKVNQHLGVAGELAARGGAGFGLEAGSKPELMAVLALSKPGGVVICNGYKDREYIRLALIGRRLGLATYIVIEKASELPVTQREQRVVTAAENGELLRGFRHPPVARPVEHRYGAAEAEPLTQFGRGIKGFVRIEGFEMQEPILLVGITLEEVESGRFDKRATRAIHVHLR